MGPLEPVRERGATLIELALVVAILASAAAAFGCAALAARPAAARTAALQYAELIAQARALAADTAPGGAAGSGATIAVVPDGGGFAATLYAFRPILGAARQPQVQPRIPPLRTAAEPALVVGGVRIAPPFALFFSASGHVAAAAPYRIGTDAPLAAEPVCPAQTGIVLAFVDGIRAQAYLLRCEFAALDVGAAVAAAP